MTPIVTPLYTKYPTIISGYQPSLPLQYRQIERGYIVWRDYTVDGEAVKSLVDIDALPIGRYRLI